MRAGLFVGQGHFSHINPALAAHLRAEMGAMIWFDAREATNGPKAVVRGVSAALHRHPGLVRHPRSLYHARINTTSMFSAMSQAAREQGRRLDAEFVFQTQTLFDGHVPGRPFFIYTDYTHLANRRVKPHFRTNTSRWLRLERNAYSAADVIFAASSTARDSLIEDYDVDPGRVVLAQTGLNVEVPEALPLRDADAFDILFVGVDWERKGGPDVVRAFHVVRERVPHATLTIIGCSPRIALPGVRVLGRRHPSEVARHMATASVFCLPSYQEPAGIAYSEASAWGLPVVSTTAGNIPDRVVDGETGILVTPGDSAALVDSLIRLASDHGLREELGRAGHRHTIENFTWERVAAVVGKAARPYLASH
jgi:glycosyltransferase involved in cell wall biosynthesis